MINKVHIDLYFYVKQILVYVSLNNITFALMLHVCLFYTEMRKQFLYMGGGHTVVLSSIL